MKEEQKLKRFSLVEWIKKDNWKIAIIILLLILVYWESSDKTEKYEKYKDCVNECIDDHEYCASDLEVFDNSGNGFIHDYDDEECFAELSSCITFCPD